MAATRPGRAVFSRLLHRLDRLVIGATGGRHSFAGLVAGVDVILVTTTGARTGLPRTVPLLTVAEGDALVVVASNWGSPRPPAWLGNVRRTPAVTVERAGVVAACRAREADAAEEAALWPRLDAAFPGYREYRRRAGRVIPLVLLEPTD
jgi:deazaflavin-dependent oxidoreductase (nitroreductase family)